MKEDMNIRPMRQKYKVLFMCKEHMVIKGRNDVVLFLGVNAFATQGIGHEPSVFVIIDFNKGGDVVSLPLTTNWKQVKKVFCVMNSHSISNKKGV